MQRQEALKPNFRQYSAAIGDLPEIGDGQIICLVFSKILFIEREHYGQSLNKERISTVQAWRHMPKLG